MESLEVSAAETLTATIDSAGIERLRQVLADEAAAGDFRERTVTVHTEIARLTGNSVLELFIHVGNNLARLHGLAPTENERRWLHERQHGTRRIHRRRRRSGGRPHGA
ncbi:FCD domain-containing protein [Nocardia sp. NBC_00565]|uniref:FCD domain-containing protein n=1 Tax=Nocardia sp. NBC_00565 TaxID=2975993 RepID=UPI002E814AA6|nr:FCD domain-containing protein [Nocardia sp. NBC_00565]WUC06803.1 FCD domain-containing protein [Nocardia sp. NBC_00565]